MDKSILNLKNWDQKKGVKHTESELADTEHADTKYGGKKNGGTKHGGNELR